MIEPKFESTEFDVIDIIFDDCKLFGKVFSLIQNVSPTDIPVLIIGEAGTFKREFAREVHKNSRRKNGKLLFVNCTNLDFKSLEIELFGCENRCSNFVIHKIGKIEQAYGGSIILEEIAETPLPIQTRLLQVLQGSEIYRVNGHTAIPIDVRIIATTSHNLEADVNDGKFRKDLFYRISTFPIIIPSIRGQYKIIEHLLNEFIKILSKKFNKKINGISEDALRLLKNYDWPGNILELKKTAEYLVKTEKTDEIQMSSLPKEILLRQIGENTIPFIDSRTQEILSLCEIEKLSLINALKATGYNIHKTAKLLGVNRATIYRKLEKYKLQ